MSREDWKVCKLGDVVEVTNGYAFKANNFTDEKIDRSLPVIKIKNVANGDVNLNDVQYHPYIEELKKFLIKRGDILLSLTGNHPQALTQVVGQTSLYKLKELSLLNQRVAKIVPKEIENNLYFYYFLKSKESHNYLASQSSGSANQANISKSDIENMPIFLPPLPEQKAIAEILSSLDDKIDLLHRQNKTLEEMAETLFRHYFIDNAASTSSPSASSGSTTDSTSSPSASSGSTTDSTSSATDSNPSSHSSSLSLSKGATKDDWKEGKLGDICTISGGYAFKSKDFTESGVPIVKIKNISNNKVDILGGQFVSNILADKIDKKYKLFDGDIVMAMTGATIGKVGLICSSDYDFLLLNQRVAVLRSEYQALLWFLLNAINLEDDILNLSNGAAQANISAFGIEEVTAPKITEEQAKKFNEEVEPMFEKILSNQKQIQTLEKLRDTLLPKLISGEVKVNYS